MSHLDAEATRYLRRVIWVPFIVGTLGIIAGWAFYIAAAFFGVNLFDRKETVGPTTVTAFLIIAAGMTAVLPFLVWRQVRKTLDLIARGRRGEAAIASVGGVGHAGQKPVTFAYVVDGKRYTMKMDMLVSTINHFTPETTVGVAYDPLNPRRAELLHNELPTGAGDNIHPGDKIDVGHRVFLAAQHLAFKQPGVHAGPLYDSMKVDGAKIRVRFKEVGSGLTIGAPPATQPTDAPVASTRLKGFVIAGPDQKWEWATAEVESADTVVIWSDTVTNPTHVRYAWADNPDCNLYNKEHLPASPFRTDDWPVK